MGTNFPIKHQGPDQGPGVGIGDQGSGGEVFVKMSLLLDAFVIPDTLPHPRPPIPYS